VIPSIPEIQNSLAALSLAEVSQASPDDRCIVVCEPTRRAPGTESGERFFQDPTALVLQQSPKAPVTIPRLLDRIAEELDKAGHSHISPKSDQRLVMAGKVLGMATALGGSKLVSINIVNHVISSISPARVSQWAVLISPGTSPEHYRFGDFIYGQIELNKLQYRSAKAGSNFAQLYGQSLRLRRSILREGRELKIIDANAIRGTGSPQSLGCKYMYRISDEYYANVAAIERQVFMVDLDRQQAIFGAAGLGTIPSESLRRMEAMTQWITIFERQERGHGWVVPNQTVMQVSTTEPKALSDGYFAIKNALKLEDWNGKPLDAAIQAFCQYLTAAQDHERNDRIEEGLLHVVFALDLLLGGSSGEALTKVLGERTAIVSHLAVERPIEEVSAFVRECYDMRSAYVHRGEKGRLVGLSERFQTLFRIARAVLGAACFARSQPWCQNRDARDTWVRRIDILKARYTAGLSFAQIELEDLGLDQIRLRTGELVSVFLKPYTEKT
jgi:hypothetical protein